MILINHIIVYNFLKSNINICIFKYKLNYEYKKNFKILNTYFLKYF